MSAFLSAYVPANTDPGTVVSETECVWHGPHIFNTDISPQNNKNESEAKIIKAFNQQVDTSRDIIPTTPSELFSLFIKSPFTPSNQILIEICKLGFGNGKLHHKGGCLSTNVRWEFQHTLQSGGAFKYSNWFGIEIRMVYTIPFAHAAIEYIDTHNDNTTVVLRWQSKDQENPFAVYESEQIGKCKSRTSLIEMAKRCLVVYKGDIDTPMISMMRKFRAAIRTLPMYPPEIIGLNPTVVRLPEPSPLSPGITTTSELDLYTHLIESRSIPSIEYLSRIVAGTIRIQGPNIDKRNIIWSVQNVAVNGLRMLLSINNKCQILFHHSRTGDFVGTLITVSIEDACMMWKIMPTRFIEADLTGAPNTEGNLPLSTLVTSLINLYKGPLQDKTTEVPVLAALLFRQTAYKLWAFISM